MKKLRLIIAFSVLASAAFAQQKPHYTQYVLNNFILNPALSGIENYTDVKISGRDQWVGLSGAPQTFYLTVHTPIGKKDYKTNASSYAIPGENPRGSAYWENYTASEPHHGIGLIVVNDRTGNFNKLNANLAYAYHIGLSPNTNMSLGFSGGISRISYDRSKATPGDINDPAIGNANGIVSKIQPDLNTGIWIYSRDYFIGVSGQQIIPQKFSINDQQDGIKLIPHLFATAGYRALITDDINAVPSLMLKYVSGSPSAPQFDLNLKLQYQDLVWMGGSYRLQDGYAAMLGFNVGNTFNMGYAYDFTRTVLNTASRGTHEVVLGFLLGNKYGDTCPRNVW